ncbi:16319_t:CDS:2 [Acaulospora colombiana]|uniref:16319_t:CDS:1 n=1 Tax=Acaulospora colombiana TaxID=27376 RepID=A0ACA9LHZ0_9GLOM|nr:16319_t:CDS:2 [Acaulospora colombiana]
MWKISKYTRRRSTITQDFEQKDPDFYKHNYVNGVYLNTAYNPENSTKVSGSFMKKNGKNRRNARCSEILFRNQSAARDLIHAKLLSHSEKVIVKDSRILATGYSRELPGNTHAEECALQKLEDPTQSTNSTIYTTMEPCSKRLSGKKPCVERIIESGLTRVVLGVREPDKFVKCEGIDILREHGIEVTAVEGLEEECLKCNKHLWDNTNVP